MEYRTLGNSGLKVPVLCLGAMTFGEADDKSFMHKVGCDEKTSFAIMSRALERGVDFIDTADVYGQDGLSERVVGAWMAETKTPRPRRARDQVPLPHGRGAERHGRVALPHRAHGRGQPAPAQDRSHRPLPDPHAGHRHARGGDAPRARRPRARRQGALPGREQLRGVPAHRQPVDREDRAPAPVRRRCRRSTAWWCATSSASTSRSAGSSGSASCRGRRSPAGFLSGKYARNQPPPAGARLEKWKERFADYDNDRGWRTLDAVRAVAKEKETTHAASRSRGCSRSRRSPRSSSARARSQQLDDNLKAAEVKLSAEDVKRLDDASAFDSATPTSSWERPEALVSGAAGGYG